MMGKKNFGTKLLSGFALHEHIVYDIAIDNEQPQCEGCPCWDREHVKGSGVFVAYPSATVLTAHDFSNQHTILMPTWTTD